MKRNNSRLALMLLAALMMLPVSCVQKDGEQATNDAKTTAAPELTETKPAAPAQLPVRFQNPAYYAQSGQEDSLLDADTEDYEIKVGANITSTRGPQPLWDIFKRLVSLKGMNVSWASDVDQNVLVDVDISADDNFYDAIDNLLRQVDYFHEVQGNTIIVKYRETRRFHVAIPYMKGTYDSNVGGNYLTDRDAATGTEGTVKVTSSANEWDVWQNITANLDMIIQEWRTQTTEQKETVTTEDTEAQGEATGATSVQQATRRVALGQSYYTIDRSIGLITVSAPRPLLEKIEYYLNTLKKELYRQVVIEAKIIEVFLQDNSKIGIDWSSVLKNFNITGLVEFGTAVGGGEGALGMVFPWSPTPNDRRKGVNTGNPVNSPYPDTYPNAFVSTISLANVGFNVMLNALNEQGDATVLSNPKLTVLNGQPAIISVGKDIAYIKEISSEVNSDTGTTSYTVTTDSVVEGISFGVMASIIDDDTVIMHLTPITTDLVPAADGQDIEYIHFGRNDELTVGLPKVQIREMSTMVQVDNGEMLIIGGLIDSVEGSSGEFAPILGDIPLIRYLFGVETKRMEKRELVILLTPKII